LVDRKVHNYRYYLTQVREPVELSIVNEVAALQRLRVSQLRQRFADLFGEATAASNRTWLIKEITYLLEEEYQQFIADHPDEKFLLARPCLVLLP
jgi:hypothetical protein